MKNNLIVIDGSNVAHNGEKLPKLSNIELVLKTVKSYTFSPIILVSAKLRHVIDDKKGLQKLILEKLVFECPAGIDDDLFILDASKRYSAPVLSNDLFKKYDCKKVTRVPYMIINGEIFLPTLNSNNN